MLQRIQTVYLLLIVILSGITFYLPVVDFVVLKSGLTYLLDFNGVYLLKSTGNVSESSSWGLTVLAGLVPIIAFVSIFMYKNRIKQIRLCVMNMLFMILYYVVLAIYIWLSVGRLEADWHLRATALFPLICLILNYLAIGAIGKDEALVKSLDRIR